MIIENEYNVTIANVPIIQLANKIKNLLPGSTDLQNLYKMDFLIDGETKVLLSSDMLYKRMMNNHYDKDYIFSPIETEFMTLLEVITDYFNIAWADYKAKNYNNFKKSFIAILKEYNPIENYDRYEDISTSYLGGETNEKTFEGRELTSTNYSGSETDSNVKSGSQSVNDVTASATDSSTGTKAPFNSEDFLNDNETIDVVGERHRETQTTFNNLTDTTTKSFTNREDSTMKLFDMRKDTDTKSFSNREDKTISHLHGNIGITKNSEMVEDELALRMKNLADMVIDEFLNMYCTYLAKF